MQKVQFETYWHNVNRLFTTARDAFVQADAILGANLLITEKARAVTELDHRVLQDAHDIMAAAYRHRHDDYGQMNLFPPHEDIRERYAAEWQRWLGTELPALTRYPKFVRAAVEAVVFQNSLLGYTAEHNLCGFLLTYYAFGDWALTDDYLKVYATAMAW